MMGRTTLDEIKSKLEQMYKTDSASALDNIKQMILERKSNQESTDELESLVRVLSGKTLRKKRPRRATKQA